MSNVISGQDVIIDFYKVDDYYPGVCAENVTMTKTAVPKSVKTIGDGPNAAYRMQSKGYTFTIDTIIPYDDAVNVTAFDLLARYENMLAVPFRMVWRDPTGTAIKGIYGSAFITEITFTGPNDFAGASITFLGTGPTENYDGLTACSASIASVVVNSQTITTVTFGYSGVVDAVRLEYTIVKGSLELITRYPILTPGASGSFTESLTGGAHTITVYPVCDNGSDGTPFVLNFTKT